MNKIPESLPNNLQRFFSDLKNYIDTDIYFYGSSIRNDYRQNQSDIDMCIFADNEKSMMNKIKIFLKGSKENIKKIVWRYEKNIIYGYKIQFKVDDNKCEVYVYNDRFKDKIVDYIRIPLHAPFYLLWILYFLKFIYYTIPILPKNTYIYLKTKCMKKLIINKDSEFLAF